MNNLKKPFFWAYAALYLYVFLLSLFVAFFLASSVWVKLIFLMLDVLPVYLLVKRYRETMEQPNAITFPLATSIMWIMVGGLITFVLLPSYPVSYSEPVHFIPIMGALMLPFGIAVLAFTVLSLKSKRISSQK